MLISLTNIYSYVHDNESTKGKTRPLEWGEKLYMAQHVVNCGFVQENMIEARCITSQINAPPHKIKITFGNVADYRQWKCSCSCKAGAGEKCKHIVATLLYVYHATTLGDLSCTDIEQKWGKRVQQQLVEVMPVEKFCHVTADNDGDNENGEDQQMLEALFAAVPDSEAALHYRQERKPPANHGVDDRDVARHLVREKNWETIYKNTQLSKFSEMLLDVPVRVLSECCVTTYDKLYPCDALEVCEQTAKNTKRWHKERQFRITGTTCYGLFTYAKDDWETKTLKHFFPKSFSGNYATRYGKEMEPFARAIYQSHLPENEEVIEYGLAVCHANPWLACSPDGIILSDQRPVRLLEIKCPVNGSRMTITECLPLLNYMKSTPEGFRLKKNHTYFAQIQLSLCILNLSSCDFILFSSFDNSIFLQKVDVDEEYCKKLLTKLKEIFFNKMLHVLCNYNN